jgi:hypothetical protein
MAGTKVETMPELEVDTLAEADDSTMPDTEDETVPKDEAGDEANGEQQQKEEEYDNLGMLVLAGEIQEYDPDRYKQRPIE